MKARKFTLALVHIMILSVCVALTQSKVSPDLRQKTFEKVWQTVNEKFWDPQFGGLDWKAVYEKYAPQVATAKTDAEFYELVNKMLGELKTSHLDILSPDVLANMQKTPTTVGLGYREIEGRLVVTRILQNSSAGDAGLKTGFVLAKIDGRPVRTLDDAQKGLSGPPDTKVTLTYLDEKDTEQNVVIEQRTLGDNNRDKLAGLNVYALIESKRLDGGIGYLRFSSFLTSLDARIRSSVESMLDAPGIIIDLRGNSGGEDSVAINLAGFFFDKETVLMITKRRKGDVQDYKAKRSKDIFRGRVVILVDELSRSQSEQFAAAMQAAGRAIVIGKTTAGGDMDADLVQLPDGSLMLITVGQPRTPKGYIIEGHGVRPDIEVALTRKELLAGKDAQLESAIEYIKTSAK